MQSSFLLLMGVGILGGVLGALTRLPSATLIGAMLAVGLFKVWTEANVPLPFSFKFAAQVGIGIMIGAGFQRQILAQLAKWWWPLLLSVLLLIGGGMMIAFLLTKTGVMDPQTAYLATSPGGMTALVVLAVENGGSAPTVALFHFVRLMIVIFSAPFVVQWIRGLSATGG